MDLPLKGDHLPGKDHVVRYCPGSKLDENGNPLGTAFFLRRGEKYLSVEWLEFLSHTNRTEAMAGVTAILSKKLRVTSASGLAVLNVGDTCTAVQRGAGRSLRILHQPSKQDAAHAGIFDTSEGEMIVAEILAESVGECCGVGRFFV